MIRAVLDSLIKEDPAQEERIKKIETHKKGHPVIPAPLFIIFLGKPLHPGLTGQIKSPATYFITILCWRSKTKITTKMAMTRRPMIIPKPSSPATVRLSSLRAS